MYDFYNQVQTVSESKNYITLTYVRIIIYAKLHCKNEKSDDVQIKKFNCDSFTILVGSKVIIRIFDLHNT